MKDLPSLAACDLLTEENAAQLQQYVQLLLKWNKAKNLIGRSTEEDVWQRHISDSLQLIRYIPDEIRVITDFGSGAGLPGVILAIMLPHVAVHLVESNGKKTRFVSEAIRHLSLSNVHVHNERIESLTPWTSDIITARAFAPLPELFSYIFPFFGKESLCILPKGSTYSSELEEAHKMWTFDYTIEPSLVQGQNGLSDGVILQVSQLQKT